MIGSLISPGFAVPFLLFPFALIHGAKRYGWKGIVVFTVITLIVSGIMENLSILTGFPFGHYYCTDGLGPKVFLVPLLIAPSYVSFGYLAWVLSTVVVGEVRRRSPLFTAVAVSLVASFMMVAWDLSLDPIASTIRRIGFGLREEDTLACRSPTSLAGLSPCMSSSSLSRCTCGSVGPIT